MESSACIGPSQRVPRSEYIPATLSKITRDKTVKGKRSQQLEDAKQTDVRSTRPSRMPKQTAYSSRVQKDNLVQNNKRVPVKQLHDPIEKHQNFHGKQNKSNVAHRRFIIKEQPIKESSAVEEIPIAKDLPVEHQNIQRVHLLNIDSDFYPKNEPRPPTRANPIPTFGQIYRNNYITDWLLESVSELIGMPDNSVFSVPRVMEITEENNDIRVPPTHIIINSTQRDHSPNRPESPISPVTDPAGVFKTTDQNICDWLTSDCKHSTKDNESGYTSTSPPSNVASGIKQNINKQKLVLQESVTNKSNMVNTPSSSTAVSKDDDTGDFLTKCGTVVISNKSPEACRPHNVYQAIPKANTDFKHNQWLNTDLRKNIKYPSTPNPTRNHESPHSIIVPSYVECPSEIVQKTTNFEGIDIISSLAVTEADTCDDMSQCTLERMDEDSAVEYRDHDWSLHGSSSQASTTLQNQSKASDTLTNNTWYNRFKDTTRDESTRKWADSNNYQDYYHQFSWKKEVNKKYDDLSLKEQRGRCNKCQKLRPKSKNRQRMSQPFETLRKRMSFGRICRIYRLKGVWKRTTERWITWTKSPSKYKKARAMHCLRTLNQRDNADQTTIYIYSETGTDAAATEQKSVEITASFKLKSWTGVCNKLGAGASGTSFKSSRSHSKSPNVGPSMFSFLHGTNSSIIRKCAERKYNDQTRVASQGNMRIADLKDVVERKDATTDPEHQWVQRSVTTYNIESTSTGTDALPQLESKVTSTMIGPDSSNLILMKKDEAVSPENLAQKIVACNNAATSIKLALATEAVASENSSSWNSAKFKSCGSDTDSRASPTRSVRPLSAVSQSLQTSSHSRPSIVTDTTVPCKKVGAKEFSTMLTPKGTILSCTGTKITSVSSTSMKGPTVLPTRSADTRDIDQLQHKEKACCTSELGSYLSTGISALSLVQRNSFNGGSCHTNRSVVAEFHPDYDSANTNTLTELTSKSVQNKCSGDTVGRPSDHRSTIDTSAQYSRHKESSDSSKLACHSACIGRSQLMTVRTLCDSATEASVQARPDSLSAETKTNPHNCISTSAFTSRYLLAEPTSTPAVMHREVDNLAPVLVCGCAKVGSSSEPCTQVTKMKSAEKELVCASKCKPSGEDQSAPTQFVATKSKSCTTSNDYQPNTVISSNLNAAKWMKGYPEKDFQSVLDISRSTVSESLERASQVLENSMAQLEETIKMAQESSNDPAINCVTTPGPARSKDSILYDLPTSQCKMVDKITSDKVVVKEMKEILIQASPTIRDSGFTCKTPPVMEKISKSVATSRYILLDPIPCCLSRNGENLHTECLFLYDRPRCLAHNTRVRRDAAIQKVKSDCSLVMAPVQHEVTNCSTEVVTEHLRQRQRCEVQASEPLEKVIPQETPPEKHKVPHCSLGVVSQRCALQDNESLEKVINPQVKPKSTIDPESNEASLQHDVPVSSAGVLTAASAQRRSQHASDLARKVLTPGEYKALYETTESLVKESSKLRPKSHISPCASVVQTGGEKIVRKPSNSRGSKCVHCCFKLLDEKRGEDHCTRSTQAVFELTHMCPHCCMNQGVGQEYSDSAEEYLKSYLASSCRYYSSMLSKRLGWVKENLKCHLTPPHEEIHKPPSITKFLIEACTMKPSGRQDYCCQTAELPRELNNNLNNLVTLTAALSSMDFRSNHDKEDLKSMYHMLSSIEGRVRRLKTKLMN